MHKLDKNIIPTVDILGVNIAAINMDWLMKFTVDHLRELSGDYICVSNVHTTVMAYEDPEYLAIQNGGIMAIPDGGPLSTLGRKRGAVNMERITGPDYMGQILKTSLEHGYSHYFYGSTWETLSRLKSELMRNYPGLQIAGMYSPPFRELTEKEDEMIITAINDADSDFLWVGLGAPKQEKWMAAHKGKVNGLMIGVGAAFDYYAGNIKRAPKWMQKTNLEWFYRLIQDPKRLCKRYFVTNSKFIWNAVVKAR